MSDYSGVGVFDPTGFLEIGWWIAKRFWGRGYATESARFDFGTRFQENTVSSLKISYESGNKASIAVMHKIGFQQKRVVF